MSVLHSSVKYNNRRQKSAQRLALLVYHQSRMAVDAARTELPVSCRQNCAVT